MIKVSFGVSMPEGRDVSDEVMKKIMNENRWQSGIILLNGHSVQGFRKKVFGEWVYRIGQQELKSVEAFNATEYQDWRDG